MLDRNPQNIVSAEVKPQRKNTVKHLTQDLERIFSDDKKVFDQQLLFHLLQSSQNKTHSMLILDFVAERRQHVTEKLQNQSRFIAKSAAKNLVEKFRKKTSSHKLQSPNGKSSESSERFRILPRIHQRSQTRKGTSSLQRSIGVTQGSNSLESLDRMSYKSKKFKKTEQSLKDSQGFWTPTTLHEDTPSRKSLSNLPSILKVKGESFDQQVRGSFAIQEKLPEVEAKKIELRNQELTFHEGTDPDEQIDLTLSRIQRPEVRKLSTFAKIGIQPSKNLQLQKITTEDTNLTDKPKLGNNALKPILEKNTTNLSRSTNTNQLHRYSLLNQIGQKSLNQSFRHSVSLNPQKNRGSPIFNPQNFPQETRTKKVLDAEKPNQSNFGFQRQQTAASASSQQSRGSTKLEDRVEEETKIQHSLRQKKLTFTDVTLNAYSKIQTSFTRINEGSFYTKRAQLRLQKKKQELMNRSGRDKNLSEKSGSEKQSQQSFLSKKRASRGTMIFKDEQKIFQKVKKIKQSQAIRGKEIKAEVQASIIKFLKKENNPFLFPEFLKDVKSAGLRGLMEDSRNAYNSAFDKILAQDVSRNKILHDYQVRNNKKQITETYKTRAKQQAWKKQVTSHDKYKLEGSMADIVQKKLREIESEDYDEEKTLLEEEQEQSMLGIYSLGKLSLKYKISLSFKDTTRKKLIRNVIRVIQLKFILLSLMGGKNGNQS